jgi:FtsZ-binding cell division protein ZapB
MRKRLIAAPFALLFVFIVGCSDTHESLADDGADLYEAMVEIIEDVDDEASAKEAGKKIAELANEAKDLATRYNELEKPTAEELKELQETMKSRMDALSKRMDEAMKKLEPSAQAALMEAVFKFGAEMSKVQK